MVELRYKAYISYSHKDEAWAKWLHRALETYRIPRKLVGKTTSLGEVPARIRPIFRDRDDLSSATNLEGTVKQALADSENLIVICSPDAAASHWVSEEIRQFALLGRGDRIFCIIVAGEPAADGSVSGSFSPALAEIGLQEPLAADVRKWADGKHVARLKLTAGLLGLRLDELLQRDLHRRRKRQLFTGLGMLSALALAIMTVLAQISERHEREKAEQLATSIVDLGEQVQSDANLETRAVISSLALKHFESLNPNKLSPETALKVALAIRQMGLVNQRQGKPDIALEAFTRSRDLLTTQVKKHPDMSGMLFQLGNAEFYIGNLHLNQGRYAKALEAMQNYHHVTSTLFDSDPENLEWIMELSYSHNNLAAVRLDSGMDFDVETQAHVTEAVRLMDSVVALKPDDEVIAQNYAQVLAWAADAQRQACNLERAVILRDRVKDLAESSARKNPGNNNLKKGFAYAVTGVARMQIMTGRTDLAEQNLELAISVLQQLSAADPSNIHYREEILYRRVMLAKLLGDTGQLGSARSMMKELEGEFERSGEFAEWASVPQKEYLDLMLAHADVESQLGNVEQANRYLQTMIQLWSNSLKPQARDIFDIQRLTRAKYQWWQLNGEDNFDGFPTMPDFDQNSACEFRSCSEVDSAARMYVIMNKKDLAAREVEYLQARGYAEPNFIRFCKDHKICDS